MWRLRTRAYIKCFRSTAKSPLLHEPKLLPRELPQSDEEADEDEDEEEEEDEKDDYVAAVCQYTTVLKETPPGFDDNKYEVNFMNLDQGTAEDIVERNTARKTSKSEGVRISETDEERRRHVSHHARQRSEQTPNSERRIEYCEEEEEDEEDDVAGHLAVSGKLAIHLDTGETSREFCLNRLDTESSQRTYTRDER